MMHLVNIYSVQGTTGCTNGGVSSRHSSMHVAHDCEPPGHLEADCVLHLVPGNLAGTAKLVPDDGCGNPKHGGMFGGNYAGTSDSRWCDAVSKVTGLKPWEIDLVPIHDRFE